MYLGVDLSMVPGHGCDICFLAFGSDNDGRVRVDTPWVHAGRVSGEILRSLPIRPRLDQAGFVTVHLEAHAMAGHHQTKLQYHTPAIIGQYRFDPVLGSFAFP